MSSAVESDGRVQQFIQLCKLNSGHCCEISRGSSRVSSEEDHTVRAQQWIQPYEVSSIDPTLGAQQLIQPYEFSNRSQFGGSVVDPAA